LDFERSCPALAAEIAKAHSTGKLLQSAVFSECVYAQALADHFGLSEFAPYTPGAGWLEQAIVKRLVADGLFPRYLYRARDGGRVLVQAGGHGGVDASLVSIRDGQAFAVEFKEPGAKTSEPDLPKYDESGDLRLTEAWIRSNPQFTSMLTEQIDKGLNFWAIAGSNVNDFTAESVQQAISENYSGRKFADVICTEDSSGFLTMIPSNHAQLWADIRGEIRPAGRNHYKVWTPMRLQREIEECGGVVTGSLVNIDLSRLKTAKPRGGNGVSRYKISPLFFVRSEDVTIQAGRVSFQLNSVRQLNPTISAHMFFRGLSASTVRAYYMRGN
jgi:hypothetical protein